MYTPFGFTGASRPGMFNQQQPNNFSGWDDRLSKIEQGIAGLTKQFSNFQGPGDVAPEYTGNAAPEPLEQTMNAPEPLELDSTAPAPMVPSVAPMGGQGQSPFGMGGGQSSLGRYMVPYQPGQEGFNPLSAEQFSSQKDLWGRRQDYRDFSSMAGDVTGIGGDIGGLRQYLSDPSFGHAYEDWQDYAAGYGGSDPSQGMENWMQDYNFDLAPERPQWQLGQGFGQGPRGVQSAMEDYQQAQLDYTNSPEYQAWKQREEARGPLSASTTQAMGGQNYMGGPPDINPYISMGMAGGQDPTYESYMEMVNQAEAGYRPQGGIENVQGTSNNPFSQATGAGITALAASRAPALQGPVQHQIQQGLGSLSNLPQGAGV